MQAEFKQLKNEFAEVLSRNSNLKKAIREVTKKELIKASLVVRNPRHKSVSVDGILEGILQKDVTVGDYVFIQSSNELMREIYGNLEMGNKMDRNLLVKAYRILSEDDEGSFRNSNPVVYGFNLVPVNATEIEQQIEEMFRKVYSDDTGDNVILNAMFIHNKIIEIWPFEEFSGELAVFAMNYYFMEKGLMPIIFDMEQQDYLDLVSACLKGRRREELYKYIYGAVKDKMKNTIEICKGYTT